MTSTFVEMIRTVDWAKCSLTIVVLISLPLLMLFPVVAGRLSGILALLGLVVLLRHRGVQSIDWNFAVVSLLLPFSLLWNMLVTGWVPTSLDRPSHLIYGLLIYFLIGRYGVQHNTIFVSSCIAVFIALGISIFETLYLGHQRVFGLGNRWNAVPFGNFSMLYGFFCLCGVFSSVSKDRRAVVIRAVLGIAGFLAGLSASALSGTRGGWLAAPFLVILCIFLNSRLSRQARIVVCVATILSILTIFSSSKSFRDRVVLAHHEITAYIAHPDDTTTQSTSTGIRLAMWSWGFKKFWEHPYTGIGLADYKTQRQLAVITGEMPGAFNALANLHNEFITTLVWGGVPAAALLVAFWILGWRFFYSNLNPNDDVQHYLALCGLVTILGTCLFSMTEGLFGTSAGTKAIMLSLALPAGMLRYHVLHKNKDRTKSTSL